MRIPRIINKDALQEYSPSPESLDLIGESERKLVAENFDWNKDHCPALANLCVISLSQHFEKYPLLDELPCEQRDYLLEILPVDLPLSVSVPRIKDEYYWQRIYAAKYGSIGKRPPEMWTWKSIYLQRYLQDLLEQAQPEYNDEENFDEILDLCAPYVRKLAVTQLQSWKPPLTMEKEDVPEEYPIEHINFLFILRKLPLVTEVALVYGVNSVGEDFSWNMFKVSVADCQRLGRALMSLQQLKILRIHKSRIEYPQCQALIQTLIKNRTIVELDLSHCEIGDQGALCIAKFLRSHPMLKILNLTNNLIRKMGAEGLGYAMVQPNCAHLECLNLRLNPLGVDGVMGIFRALVRCGIPAELSLSGCLFEESVVTRLSLALKMNSTLKKLDISNNWVGEKGGQELIEGLKSNITLESFDARDTDMSPEQIMKIEKIMFRNRTGIYETDEMFDEDHEEVEEKVTEYQKAVE